MGLFRFLKRSQQQQEEFSKDKYWSLTTNEGEVIEPNWEQVTAAVRNATPDGSIFASLGCFYSGLEIEIIQVIGDGNGYRFEALPPNGKIFVNDGISYEETLKLFEEFFKHQRVVGFSSWPTEKMY